jgi:hypothetical protein
MPRGEYKPNSGTSPNHSTARPSSFGASSRVNLSGDGELQAANYSSQARKTAAMTCERESFVRRSIAEVQLAQGTAQE